MSKDLISLIVIVFAVYVFLAVSALGLLLFKTCFKG